MTKIRLEAALGQAVSVPTIGDVAALAGVSSATVSRVLNSPSQVGKERRARVEAAIQQLNFVPLAAAQTLKSGRSMTVGAIFPRLDSILFGSILNQLQTRFDQAGYTLITMTTVYNAATEPLRVRQLIARGVDALILLGGMPSPETDALINEYQVPRMNLWSWLDDCPSAQIGFCLRRAASMAADHVCALGHKRVGVISAHPETNDMALKCRLGINDSLVKWQVEVDEDLFVASNYSVEDGSFAFSSLISQPDPPTAILCTSDIFAAGAMREARRMGLNVPRDISITGFDDSDFAKITNPGLTSIRTEQAIIGTRCAESILGHLTESKKLVSLELGAELIVRESTAPPNR